MNAKEAIERLGCCIGAAFSRRADLLFMGRPAADHEREKDNAALAVLSALAEENSALKRDLLDAYAAATEKNKELAALKAELDAANKECDIKRESLRVAQAEIIHLTHTLAEKQDWLDRLTIPSPGD